MSLLQIYTNSCVVLRLSHRPPSQHPDLNERRRRTNQIIVGVTLVFFLSWLPLNTFRLLAEFGPLWIHPLVGGREELIFGLLNLLGATNACVNPILYGYFNENFRNEYRDIYKAMPWYRRSTLTTRRPMLSMNEHPTNSHLEEVVVARGTDQRSETPCSSSSLSINHSSSSTDPKLSQEMTSQANFQFHSSMLVPPLNNQHACTRKSRIGGTQIASSTFPTTTSTAATTSTLSWSDKDKCDQSYAPVHNFGSQSSPSSSSSLSSSSFSSGSSSTIMWMPKGYDRIKASSSAFIKVHPCSSSTSLCVSKRTKKGDTNQIFLGKEIKQNGAKNSPRVQMERDLKSNIFVLFLLEQNVDETFV